MAIRILAEDAAVDRLAELGISVDMVERVVRRANAEANLCTPLDPPIMEGLTRWGRTTRYLREELIPTGWRFDNPRNLARTIHPDGEFAIVATSGDEATGLIDLVPTTRYPKGYATVRAVETNEQLALDFDDLDLGPDADADADADEPIISNDMLTWYMLFYKDDEGFRVELSLPDGIVDGRITSWVERIVLPTFPHDEDRSIDLTSQPQPVDQESDIVVEVARR
jgi:hypothetical protein